MSSSDRRPAAEFVPAVLGIATIISGAATGLFSDLRVIGRVAGLAAVVLWVFALGALLVRLGRESDVAGYVRVTMFTAFALTAVLLLIALQTGPLMSPKTLVLSERGARSVAGLCPALETATTVATHVALSQINDQFVHIELRDRRCTSGDADVRIRSDDLLAILPSR
jgi:hypothetical protein